MGRNDISIEQHNQCFFPLIISFHFIPLRVQNQSTFTNGSSSIYRKLNSSQNVSVAKELSLRYCWNDCCLSLWNEFHWLQFWAQSENCRSRGRTIEATQRNLKYIIKTFNLKYCCKWLTQLCVGSWWWCRNKSLILFYVTKCCSILCFISYLTNWEGEIIICYYVCFCVFL